jgi:hypothetical protein
VGAFDEENSSSNSNTCVNCSEFSSKKKKDFSVDGEKRKKAKLDDDY